MKIFKYFFQNRTKLIPDKYSNGGWCIPIDKETSRIVRDCDASKFVVNHLGILDRLNPHKVVDAALWGIELLEHPEGTPKGKWKF